MRKKEKEENQTYGVFSNLIFMAKRISQFDKSLFLYLPLPMIAQMGLSLIGIYIPKIIIDSLTNGVSLNNLLLTIAVIAILLYLFRMLQKFAQYGIMEKAMSNRIGLFPMELNKTRSTDYENISTQSGQSKRRKALECLQSNTSGAEVVVTESVGFIKNFSGLIIYGVILGTLNIYIVLLLLLGAIINIVAARAAIKYDHRHKDDYTPIDNKIYYMREQTVDISNAKDIRVYSMAEWLMSLFKDFIYERHTWHKKVANRKYAANVADTIIILLRDGLAYSYLIYRVFNGLPVGDFVLYFGAITGFSLWLSGLIQNAAEINRGSLQINDLRQYADMPDVSNRGEGLPLSENGTLMYSIELKNVSYKYPENDEYIIENLNLKIEKGEKLAVVGVNGAGKTTIVKLICGLIFPSAGEILINGVNMNEYNIDDYHNLYSVAFQDACILSFTIAENVSMQPVNKCNMNKIDEVLKRAGLKKKTDTLKEGSLSYINNIFTDDGIDLSGGEKQKLILARALYKDAPMLILDEPTAALDPIAESKLYEEYAKMTQGKTSVYISHRLASTRFCDRIIFVENGKISEMGTHDELMDLQGKYAHMFEVQSHYYAKDMEVRNG